MNIAAFALLCLFVASNVYVEYANRGRMHWWDEPLSAYLRHVTHAAVQRTGYLGMAAGLALLATAHPGAARWCFAVGAFGLTLVVATRWPSLPSSRAIDETHYAGAALAYVGAFAGEWIALDGSPGRWFVIAGAAIAVWFTVRAHDRTALLEKGVTACVVAGALMACGVTL